MANILLDAQSILEIGGYRTLVPNPASQHLYFEDSNVLGAVFVLDSVAAIVQQWQELQDNFLQQNGQRLAFDALKAWNSYSVFLTAQASAERDASTLSVIEENFRGTRKLVRASIKSKLDAEKALAPLLPLRQFPSFTSEDVKERLASRLGEPGSALRALVSSAEAADIAASLMDSE